MCHVQETHMTHIGIRLCVKTLVLVRLKQTC